MGSYILRGITTALLITVLTLFAGIIWSSMGLRGLSISQLLDIGLLASCLIGGYRTAKESKLWFMGGVAGAGYVTVGTLLLALFLPIRGLGFLQVLAEGALIGLVAGAFGAGNTGKAGKSSSEWNDRQGGMYYTPSYAGHGKDKWDNHCDWDWDREDEYAPRAKSTGPSWVESSDDEFINTQKTKQNDVVEWPWDREHNEENEYRNKRKAEVRQSTIERNDLVVWDKGEEKAKPWWEQ